MLEQRHLQNLWLNREKRAAHAHHALYRCAPLFKRFGNVFEF
jgi:hypothetical protein